MKSVRMMICLLAVIFVGFLADSVLAQQQMNKEQYLQYVRNGKEQSDYRQKMEGDKDDRSWGMDDWATRTLNKAWHEKFGYPLYKTETLYEHLADAGKYFKLAEANLNGAEEKALLVACQKMREAGIILEACHKFPIATPEVNLADYTGPFFSREGRRDDQFMVQEFIVRAYDNYAKAGEDYLKVLSKTSVAAQARVAIALFGARGKDYEVERYQLALRFTGKLPEWTPMFSTYIYEYHKVPLPHSVQAFAKHDADRWRTVFANLRDPNAKDVDPKKPNSVGIVSHDLCLAMDVGNNFDGIFQKMISRDEFLFIDRQADQAWQILLNPPGNLKDLQGDTYWKRDADPNEPPLLLRVSFPHDRYCSGHTGAVALNNHLPNSFLKWFGWKQELDDFEKSLPTDGVTQNYIDWYHSRTASCDMAGLSEDARRRWVEALRAKEKELYELHFAAERLKWHRVSAEEYAKLKTEQDEWVKAHSDSAFQRKLAICANFQALSPTFNDCSTTSQREYTLDLLEKARGIGPVANLPK